MCVVSAHPQDTALAKGTRAGQTGTMDPQLPPQGARALHVSAYTAAVYQALVQTPGARGVCPCDACDCVHGGGGRREDVGFVWSICG